MVNLMQPDAPAEFDAYDHRYNETIDRALAFSGLNVDFFTRVKVDYLLELLGAPPRSPARIRLLDIGCGIANSHPLLAGRVSRLAGVDISKTCLAQAAARNPENEYKFYDGTNLPYPSASFDAASAICVFHHIPPAERLHLANDIRRVLQPGGMLAVFEHNPLNPLTMHVVNNCEIDMNAMLLRRRETEKLLGDAGFRQIWSRSILTVPAKGRLLRNIDKLFGRLPLGAQYYSVGRA
jgi:ubiquinone/menaquinone biosynthesis C-methylase UbiE